jgi:hypothetical protein
LSTNQVITPSKIIASASSSSISALNFTSQALNYQNSFFVAKCLGTGANRLQIKMMLQFQFSGSNLFLGLIILIWGLHTDTTTARPHSPLTQIDGYRASFVVRGANPDIPTQLSAVPRALAKRDGFSFGKMVIVVTILALTTSFLIFLYIRKRKAQQGKNMGDGDSKSGMSGMCRVM